MLTIPDRYDASSISLQSLLLRKYAAVYVVHRLDRETSGLLVFALSSDAHRSLSMQFEHGTISKSYYALVCGSPDRDTLVMDLPLSTDADRSHRTRADRRRGKPSLTRATVIERFDDFALVLAEPETGRTHQIRVHLAAAGYPIVADPLYGSGAPLLLSSFKRSYRAGRDPERPLIGRTALHACALSFDHPQNGERIAVNSDVPRDLRAALNQLRKHGSARVAAASSEDPVKIRSALSC